MGLSWKKSYRNQGHATKGVDASPRQVCQEWDTEAAEVIGVRGRGTGIRTGILYYTPSCRFCVPSADHAYTSWYVQLSLSIPKVRSTHFSVHSVASIPSSCMLVSRKSVTSLQSFSRRNLEGC